MYSGSVQKITNATRTLSISEEHMFLRARCHSAILKKPPVKKPKICCKRLSFSPNINLLAMSSPAISPIKRENSGLTAPSTPLIFDFSPRAVNRILQLDANKEKLKISSPHNVSYLNKTISIENILRSCRLEKYVELFRKEEIDNLQVFSSLTEQDLVEIGIKNRSDRIKILEISAEYQGDL